MSAEQKTTPGHAHLWPLKQAADVAGVSPKLFVAAVDRGDMPGVELLLLGARGRRFVRAASLMAYLEAPAKGRKSAGG
jgi:hypothetical protein